MLDFFEAYRQYDVPERLKNEIISHDGTSLQTIQNLNKINILVGANNSGKSIVLRELLKTRSKTYYSDEKWQEIKSILKFFDTVIDKMVEVYGKNCLFSFHNNDKGSLFDLEHFKKIKETFEVYKANYNISQVANYLIQFFSPDFSISHTNYFLKEANIGTKIFALENGADRQEIEAIISAIEDMKKELPSILLKIDSLKVTTIDTIFNRVYIPSIRTLRPFGKDTDLENKLRSDYGLDMAIAVVTGQNFPENVFTQKNTEWEDEQNIKEFENLLSEEFFDKQSISLKYHKDKKILYIKIGEEKSRPIYELGEGLQMIIILIHQFFSFRGGIIAIEEPELYIHPGLQKAFIKFLVNHSRVKEFQIFLTTHSNHIIDSVNLSDDVSLFSIAKAEKPNSKEREKTPNFIIQNLAFGNENLLTCLGITSTSVYLSNCTIWVEGITDKIYIQTFLKAFLDNVNLEGQYEKCKVFKEGINYSFALTGGDSIIHWDFSEDAEYKEHFNKIIVRQFCAKSFVIVDNDFGKNPERKERLLECMNDRFHELKYPEIENLLGPAVIMKTLSEYHSVKKQIQNNPLAEITETHLSTFKTGKIIDDFILNAYSKVKKFSISNENGSLKSTDKYEFCQKAIKHITASNLSKEASNLVMLLLDFIMSKN